MKVKFALLSSMLFAFQAFAQNSDITAPVNETYASKSNFQEVSPHFYNGLSLFAATYLGNAMSLGGGLGLEYQFTPYIAVFAVSSHYPTDTSGGDPLGMISGETTTNNSFEEVGIKYFPAHWWIGAPFVNVGYQRGVTSVNVDPGLLGGPTESTNLPYEGASFGTGFRFYSIKNRVFTLLIDAGVNYSPGNLDNSHYVVDSGSFPTTVSAHAEASLKYDFVPFAQLGLQF